MIRTSFAVTLLAACALTGCNNNDNTRADPDPADPNRIAEPGLSSGALAGIPLEVQDQILTDLSGKQIASSEIMTGDTGTLYRVTYYEAGEVKSRTYDRDGIAVVLPGVRQAAEAATRESPESDPIDQ